MALRTVSKNAESTHKGISSATTVTATSPPFQAVAKQGKPRGICKSTDNWSPGLES